MGLESLQTTGFRVARSGSFCVEANEDPQMLTEKAIAMVCKRPLVI
jgi:hypothetical protein